MQGASYSGQPPDCGLKPCEQTGFYDWRRDDTAIQQVLDWPLEGLLFDAEDNALWLDSWGARPDSKGEREVALGELVRATPPLIPVYGHRYLVGHPLKEGNPVLSVYQADVIVYGANLLRSLVGELGNELDFNREWRRGHLTGGVSEESIQPIPFWGEILGD